LIRIFKYFYQQVPQGDELESLLAATAMFWCTSRGVGHPQLQELLNACTKMLLGAAAGQGVVVDGSDESIAAYGNWFQQPHISDPDVFLPKLFQRLEAIVGDGWLFDRSRFGA
jgi:hypothetical protein